MYYLLKIMHIKFAVMSKKISSNLGYREAITLKEECGLCCPQLLPFGSTLKTQTGEIRGWLGPQVLHYVRVKNPEHMEQLKTTCAKIPLSPFYLYGNPSEVLQPLHSSKKITS